MSHGGARPGAGRPRKKPVLMDWPPEGHPPVTPIQYLLHVLNDDTATSERRDRAALAAVGYVHGRKSGSLPCEVDDWGDDLQ